MAKRKKNTPKAPATQPAAKKKVNSTPWIITAVVLAAVIIGLVVGAAYLHGQGIGDTDTNPGNNTQSISPDVSGSKTTTMRIVKPGTAYLTKETGSGTVFSFRRGDQVEVVELDKDWATIAVEGRGYYLPRDMVRGLEDYIIVLDAGHQLHEDIGKEAIGPGGKETEQKMDVGHTGVYTGQAEHELTMTICEKLKTELEKQGYTVYLTRSNSGTNSSYKERAEVANKLNADAYLTIHNGYSDDPAVRGLGAVCQTSKNPYISDLYAENADLCKKLLLRATHATGSKKLDIRETDDLSGINWCRVPMAMLELGYLSNENDDRLLTSEAYLEKLVTGLADGLSDYFKPDTDTN